MKTEHSKLYQFFFSTKAKIDSSKFNYQEKLNYNWFKFNKAFSHLFLCVVYNTFFFVGWVSMIHSVSQGTNPIQTIQSSAELSGYAIGHASINAVHFVVHRLANWFSPSVKKDQLIDGSAVPTIKASSMTMWIILLVPFIIWLLGKLIIKSKVKKYLAFHNNSLLTQTQLDARILQEHNISENNAKASLLEKKAQILEKVTNMVDNTTPTGI